MAYLIDRLKQSLYKKGISVRSGEARAWLEHKVKQLTVTPSKLLERQGQTNQTMIGGMYFYVYDPKTKNEMAFYDKFPLVIPVEKYSDGFLGLNLHYIHPQSRLVLLDKLSDIATNTRFDESTKFRISYGYLKRSSQIYEHHKCLKRYLYSHVRSKFVKIDADEWDIAALLPAENFEKKTKEEIYGI